jgi:hypothetical protein
LCPAGDDPLAGRKRAAGAKSCGPQGLGTAGVATPNKNSHAFKHLAHGYEKTLQDAFTNAAFLLIHK